VTVPSSMTPQDARAALVAVLRGDDGAAVALTALPLPLVRETALEEGVAPLVAEQLSLAGATGAVYDALAAVARRDALVDVLRGNALLEVMDALHAAGIRACLFKGEQVARMCYERTDLRPRLDSDLLVAPDERTDARRVLEATGYTAVAQLEADLISYQCTYVRPLTGGAAHVVDLHWRIANPQDFGAVLSVDEVRAASVPIPGFAAAYGLARTHALLLSIVHPAAHHSGRERLIWDLDTARLASPMRDDDWTWFVALARERNVAAMCHTALGRVAGLFAARIPSDVLETLAAERKGPGPVRRRPSTQAAALVSSVRALPSWRDRTTLIRQHLLPPSDYMRRVYAPASRAPLAFLYLRRALSGAWRYCRRTA
jgi:hypothetical protein